MPRKGRRIFHSEKIIEFLCLLIKGGDESFGGLVAKRISGNSNGEVVASIIARRTCHVVLGDADLDVAVNMDGRVGHWLVVLIDELENSVRVSVEVLGGAGGGRTELLPITVSAGELTLRQGRTVPIARCL